MTSHSLADGDRTVRATRSPEEVIVMASRPVPHEVVVTCPACGHREEVAVAHAQSIPTTRRQLVDKVARQHIPGCMARLDDEWSGRDWTLASTRRYPSRFGAADVPLRVKVVKASR